jgi:hypothetical protein
MSTSGATGRATAGQAGPGGDASAAVRGALQALARVSRTVRTRPGAIAPPPFGAEREAWLEGIQEALEDLPVLALGVSPGAITLGDTPVLDGADRAIAEALHVAGVRAVTVFGGIGEDELVALAVILVTAWDGPNGARFEAAAWGADLPHVYFDLAMAPAPALAGLPSALRLLALQLEAPAAEPTRVGPLAADAVATLRDLRDTIAPEPAALLDVHPAVSALPPEIVAEAAVIRAGADLDPGELAAALEMCLVAEPDPGRVVTLARALVAAAVDLFGGGADPAPLAHLALELLDTELTPTFTGRPAAGVAFRELAADPLRATLAARLPHTESADARGALFSLLCLADADGAEKLAEVLPHWAVRVLADTVLLRETDAGGAQTERIRARLTSSAPSTLLLGLAMAARIEDGRLLESVLALAEHKNGDVRESVLFALRQQRSPRVRELVRRHLGDPAEGVRIEALRYSVAYRVNEATSWLEERLSDPALATSSEVELRALCIAYGRLARERAEGPLLDLALGRRRGGSPALARYALHGLRAVGSPRARGALEHVAADVPRLRDEALGLLAGDGR